jgi:hypothetical protein
MMHSSVDEQAKHELGSSALIGVTLDQRTKSKIAERPRTRGIEKLRAALSVLTPTKARTRWQKVKRTAINVFLGFHVVAITLWCIPIDSPVIPLCKQLIRPYFLWSGLFQSWDMFAPTPKSANSYLEAVLIYEDGSRKTWAFPRMDQLGLTDKYFKERYRKFTESLVREENEPLLVDAARYIARLNSSPNMPVKTVVLVQNYSYIVPRPDGSYVPEPWQKHILLGYGVRPEDLK